MTGSPRLIRGLLSLVLLAAVAGPVRAEDTRHKWQFGFGASFFSIEDDIRSDADLAGCVGEIGNQSCSLPDERPDSNLLNENSVRDDLALEFRASYGFTRFFAMEFAASYFESVVSSLETFRSYFQEQNIGTGTETKENNLIQAADFTSMPLSLSALIRFRPESPFAPYVGAGVGYQFNDLKSSAQLNALNTMLNEFQQTDAGAPFGPDGILSLDPDPGLPEQLQQEPSRFSLGVITDPVQITVNDGFTFHIRGGMDYYFTRKFSLYVDGTYTWANPDVAIRVAGSPQGQITVQEFFGPGGDGLVGPTVLENGVLRPANAMDTCRDSLFAGISRGTLPECRGDDLNGNFIQDPGEGDLDGNGVFNRTFGVCVDNCDGIGGTPVYEARFPDQDVILGTLTLECIAGDKDLTPGCPGTGGTGDPPVYEWVHRVANQPFQIAPADDLIGVNTFIIQGGDIDLEGFSLGVGVKFTF